MIQRFISFTCALLFIIPINSPSQTVNFEKFLNETQILYSVRQTYDNGYILSGIESVNETHFTKLIKTDENGDIVWTRKFPGISGRSHYRTMAVQTSDGGYALCGSVEESEDMDILLIRTDAEGGVSWQQNYSSSLDEFSWSVEQTYDKGFLITANTDQWTYDILKTDSLGIVEWEKEIGPISSVDRRSQTIQTADLGYVIVSKQNLFKLDKDGDSLWTKTFESSFNHVQENTDRSLVFAGKNIMMKTDSLGEEIWTNENLSLYPNSLCIASDGDYLVVQDQIVKMDDNGTELWRIDLDGIASSVQSTTDDGYTYCGGELSIPFHDKGWFVKADQDGYYQSLVLSQPEEGNIVWYHQDFPIAWRQVNIDKIQILFSANNGEEWQEIIDTYDADEGSYSWQVPFLISDQCKIRLKDNQSGLYSENTNPFSILINYAYDYIAVNEIRMWFSNHGDGSHCPYTDGAGFLWPGGMESTIPAIFEDGLVFAGMIDGKYYAGGNTHFQGLQAGSILEDGTAANPDSLPFKVWKIRRDWGVYPPGPDRDRLEYDYQNWPVHLGAPWRDNNGDGIYDPEVDQPKLYGDETNWMIMNDLDSTRTEWFGSDPVGLEIHSIIYGYDRQDALADVVFKKYKVINKGQNSVKDMAFGYWSDVDLGYGTDDFMGCDTLLDLAFSYNASNSDNLYGSPPPAVGYMLFQGPLIEGNANDSAWYNGDWISGYRNLKMTSFSGFI